MQIVTLSNGKKVANFSSPHPFTFTDGTILPAVSDIDAKYLEVKVIETEVNDKGDLSLSFELTSRIRLTMAGWRSRWAAGQVDVVICPLIMLVAIATELGDDWLLDSPFRSVRMEDRIKKLISIDKQCLAKGQY